MPDSELTVLEEGATQDQLLQAVAANHEGWMILGARVAGGEVHHETGATWVYTPGWNQEVAIPFPRLTSASAGAQLDEIVRCCRRHPALRQVSCWSLEPPQPRDLGA